MTLKSIEDWLINIQFQLTRSVYSKEGASNLVVNNSVDQAEVLGN